MFLQLLSSYVKPIIAGLVLIALVSVWAYIRVLKSDIEKCEAEKTALTVSLKASQDAVKNLQAAIDDQNKAVQKLKEDSDKRAKANWAELNKARTDAESIRNSAKEILNTSAPAGISKCEAADKLFDHEIKKNAKK